MGYIQEEIKHPEIEDVIITVDEQAMDEMRESWDIVELSIAFADINTPDQLISIGRWLIQQGKRIKREYTREGTKK